MMLGREETPKRVYVVMRVFDIGKESCGIDFYIDPESMVYAGKLKEDEEWKITPTEI